jgi:hypothetical protein
MTRYTKGLNNHTQYVTDLQREHWEDALSFAHFAQVDVELDIYFVCKLNRGRVEETRIP